MRESPLQNAVDDEVWIAPNGRSEVRVLVEAKCEMAERIRCVTGLLERTQQQIRQNSFFRLPRDFADEALIMLRRDAQFSAGERDAHGALAAVAVGIGPAGLCGGRNAPVADGNFALVQIFDPEGIAESARQLFELQNFPRIGLFVNTMQGFDTTFEKIARDGAVGREHEFFNQAMRDVALAARDVDHALLFVKFDDRLGQIEIDRAMLVASSMEQERQLFHVAEMLREPGVT